MKLKLPNICNQRKFIQNYPLKKIPERIQEFVILNNLRKQRKSAARLERSSFCEEKRRAKKREWKTEMSAQLKLIVQFQHRHKCGLRNLYSTDLLHFLFPLFLFLQQFTLTGNISTVAFCGNVFS